MDPRKAIPAALSLANQLDAIDPSVSYALRMRAITVGLENQANLPQFTHNLETAMSWCEKNKSVKLVKADAPQYLSSFAQSVMTQASNDEESGNVTRNTVQAFLSVVTILDSIRQYGPLDEQVCQVRVCG